MKWSIRMVEERLVLDGSSYEESGAEIYATVDGTFDLYEITQYGTATLFDGNYANINEAIQVAESWT